MQSLTKFLKREDGFSLVEMVVASAVLLFSVAVILNSFVTGNIIAKRSGNLSIGANLAQRKLERLKNKSYAEVTDEAETDVGSDYPGLTWSVSVDYVQRNADGSYSVVESDLGLKQVVVNVSWPAEGSHETQVTGIVANPNMYGNQGSVSGTVFEADGSTPVAGATVATSDGLYSDITDWSGSYSISYLIPDTYTLYATKSGYNTSFPQTAIITAGATTTDIDFSITNNPGSISGTIFHEATTATVEGASLVTSPGGYAAASGAGGSFTVSGVLPGDYTVTATASGYQFGRQYGITVSEGANTADVDFQLVAGGGVTGTITGTVYASDGSKIGGATVLTDLGGYTTTTNNFLVDGAYGTYALYDVIPGTYQVKSSAAGYTDSQASGRVVSAGNTIVVDLTLKGQVGSVRGRVTNNAGNAVSGVRLTLSGTSLYAVSNPDGYYSIYNIPAGSYDLTASQTSPSKSQTVGVEVLNAQETVQNFNTGDFN
jgi:Tfp pilus assembly protein PilV